MVGLDTIYVVGHPTEDVRNQQSIAPLRSAQTGYGNTVCVIHLSIKTLGRTLMAVTMEYTPGSPPESARQT